MNKILTNKNSSGSNWKPKNNDFENYNKLIGENVASLGKDNVMKKMSNIDEIGTITMIKLLNATAQSI